MEFNSRIPIYLQVIDEIKKRLATGKLIPGCKLPSTRLLAQEFSINPNTAARIYKEMELMNICYTKRGLGTFVCDSINIIAQIKKDMASILINNFNKEMIELGYTKKQIIEEIRKKE